MYRESCKNFIYRGLKQTLLLLLLLLLCPLNSTHFVHPVRAGLLSDND